VTLIQRYYGSAEAICEQTTFYYDSSNLFDGTFSQYAISRLAAVQYGTPDSYLNTGGSCGNQRPYGFTELYSYTPGGLVTRKRLSVKGDYTRGRATVSLETSQTYDNEGKVLTVKYPDVFGYDFNGAGPMNLPGRVYTYAYDGLGRPIGLTDNQQTPLSWVNNVQYGPASELQQMTYSLAAAYADDAKDLYSIGSVTETRVYNSRLKLTSLTGGDLLGAISVLGDTEQRADHQR